MNNPKKRGYKLPKPLPLAYYTKVNVHTKRFVVGKDVHGKDITVSLELATLINPLQNRRAARKARKAAKLAAGIH